MKIGIFTLNFGEPEHATPQEVVPFLERIFLANSSLEGLEDPEARRARSHELAVRRAPGLIEEYVEIGGSPLMVQADAQAEALARELDRRGLEVTVYSAFQFTEPLVPEVIARARSDGMERLIGLPIYPLCGHSTNVAALDQMQSAIDELAWDVRLDGVTGWHRHPLYLQLRAEAVLRVAEGAGLDLTEAGTRLVFSAHGTPKKYLDAGSRYVEYVEEFCREMADLLGVSRYELGYQNHSNRGIEWTQPDIDSVIGKVEAERVVVDPVSFMHEQSETLAELDHELREEAEGRGLEFHRVPVPHDDPRFAVVLADLVEPLVTGSLSGLGLRFGRCRCREKAGTFCLNSLPREEAAPRPVLKPTA